MEEAAVHAGAIQQAHRSGVAVGQDGFGPEFVGHRLQALGDGVERLVPGDPLEAAFAFGADALLRIQQPVGMILAFEILRDFAAKKAASYRVVRVAAQREPRPSSSTSISSAQVSGQSSAHTERRIIFLSYRRSCSRAQLRTATGIYRSRNREW